MEGIRSSVEDIDSVTKLIKVTIPSDSVEKEIKTSLDQISKQVSIKGFRQGKAPSHIVESMHGERVRGEANQRLISNSLEHVVKTNSIEMVGPPKIESVVIEKGKDLEYSAQVFIFPRPEIKGYDSFELTVSKKVSTDKDLDEVIERMRDSKATLRKLEFRNTAQKGDVIEASVTSTIAGQTPEPSEPIKIPLGEGQLPQELDEGLIGLEVGESRSIVGKLPENHRDANLRGKEVTYQVSLIALHEKVLPELNDDFAKSLGLEVQTLLELRMKARKSLDEETEKQAKVDTEAALLEKLVEANSFEIPQILIDEEIRTLVLRSGLVDPKKINPETLPVEPFREGLGEIAIKRVRSAIVVDRIAEIEKIQADEEEVRTRIAEIAAENSVSEDEVKKFLAQSGRMMGLLLEMTRSKVLKFLTDRAKITFTEKKEEEVKADK